MKNKLLLSLWVFVVLLSAASCKKEDSDKNFPGPCLPEYTNCYKGRLEIQGICSNYTIKLVEGTIDPSLIQATWQSPKTGETLTNVFRLNNSCDFPATIKEGDEFYFRITSKEPKNCGICQAYYPTPEKGLFIEVLSGSCPLALPK